MWESAWQIISHITVSSYKFYKHPRFSSVACTLRGASLSMEKPVWTESLQSKWEVCILPEPAQAVVQTRKLNEA